MAGRKIFRNAGAGRVRSFSRIRMKTLLLAAACDKIHVSETKCGILKKLRIVIKFVYLSVL